MPNEKNLIPNSQRTPEQLREMAAAGGDAYRGRQQRAGCQDAVLSAFKKINKLVTFVTTGCAILVPSKRRGRGLIPGLADLFKMLEATA